MNVPVLVIAFNRSSTLRVLLDRLLSVGASDVYFAIDGPRPGRPDDVAKVEAVKRAIQDTFNPDDGHFLVQSKNLGIRRGPPAAISWFFSMVELGVILEDDCIPGDDFFPFMAWALERYKNEDRVKMIAGFNRFGRIPGPESFRFIKSAMIWGWASWRRAWVDYDPEFIRWGTPEDRRKLDRWLGSFPVRDYWREAMAMVSRGQLITWDTAWCWTIFNQQGLVVLPSVSLIQNIGFGSDATNTNSNGTVDERSLIMPTSLPPPYREPKRMMPDNRLQRRIDRKEFWRTDSLIITIAWKHLRSYLISFKLGKSLLTKIGTVKRQLVKR
jgi:hypothetical protein